MKRKKVSELSRQIRGVSYKPEDLHKRLDKDSVILLRANNILEGKINFDDIVFVDKSKVSRNQYLRKDDILICASSGSKQLVGKAARVDFDDIECTFGAFCKVVRPNQGIARYLNVYFQSANYRQRISELAIGANINNIRNEHIDDLELPVGNDSENARVVATVTMLQQIIDGRKQQLHKLDELIKARFVELFGDLKSNSKGWPIVAFTECAKIDTNMIHDFNGYEDYPHIGIDSIEKETGRLSGYRTVAEDGIVSGKYLFTEKHIIYSKIRPNLNKVAMPDFVGVCSADAYPILVKDDVCVKEYLVYTMRSKYFLDYILSFSSRTNLPKVNKRQVEGFSLPLPAIELQQQFATFVAEVDKSKVAVQKALDEAQLLFDSLMQKYFG